MANICALKAKGIKKTRRVAPACLVKGSLNSVAYSRAATTGQFTKFQKALR